MEDSRDASVDRLRDRVRPRWDRERHERVFAAIIERIRSEEGRRGRKAAAARGRLQLNHATR
jgi:hypothetical protein